MLTYGNEILYYHYYTWVLYFFWVAVCYSRTPKGKKEKVIKNQQKKTIKIQNKIKINKTVKNNNNKKQLITKNVYISKLQHR